MLIHESYDRCFTKDSHPLHLDGNIEIRRHRDWSARAPQIPVGKRNLMKKFPQLRLGTVGGITATDIFRYSPLRSICVTLLIGTWRKSSLYYVWKVLWVKGAATDAPLHYIQVVRQVWTKRTITVVKESPSLHLGGSIGQEACNGHDERVPSTTSR